MEKPKLSIIMMIKPDKKEKCEHCGGKGCKKCGDDMESKKMALKKMKD